MAGTALQRRLTWLIAEVVDTIAETPRVRTLVLECPGWPGHLPGQHVDIRLTDEDGYQAQRSYSIATPADGDVLELTVELVQDGEVSPYLIETVRPGDRFELRGPIGGFFVWEPARGGPVQLIAGGSGVVPLMAMLRAREKEGSAAAVRALLSWRTPEEVIYRDELDELASREGIDIVHTFTRRQPDGWEGYSRRVDAEMLAQSTFPAADRPLCFVCGPTGLVESVASALVALGHPPDRVRTERFGPSGGAT